MTPITLKLEGIILRLYPDGDIRADKKVILTEAQKYAVVMEQRKTFKRKTDPNGFEFRAGFKIKI